MSSRLVLLSLLVATMTTTTRARADSPVLTPTHLRIEYHTNPLGLDITDPRFSWLLNSASAETRDQSQSAYQILVASSKDKLNEKDADLWNTTKVSSSDTSQITYAGKPLASQQQCFWTVRAWNGSDQPSDFAPAQTWTMGLLKPEDWKAQWIGYDAADTKDSGNISGDPTVNLDGAKWIWTDIALPATVSSTQPVADVAYFRQSVTIPAGRTVRAATLMITADNRFDVFINGAKAGEGTDFHLAYANPVTNNLRPGENVIAIKVTNSGGPAGVVARMRIDFAEGDPIVLETSDAWKVSREAKGNAWRKSGFNEKAWKAAKVVATVGDQPWGTPQRKELVLPPPPYLRKTFAVEKEIKRATLFATALGLYELRLNGERIGDIALAPGWTDFNKRVYYNTYDVTSQVKSGKNALAAILADGWFEGYLGYSFKRHNYNHDPRLRAQLELEFSDGSKQTVITDESWRAEYGPIREADLLMGTTYDANREMPGWDAIDFDDTGWKTVVTGCSKDIAVQSHPGDIVRRIQELPAQKVSEPKPGIYVFDLGQNMVGTCRLRLAAPKPNQKFVIRYAEMLNPDGTLYTTALRAARATDTYVSARAGEITWEPPFTFHGFRYVEIAGLTSPPSTDAVTGIVLHSTIEPAGTFECSDKRINQLFHNIIWGQKGNYLEIPTDCPQRDERLGWTGDANFFVRTAAYNFDVAAFYTKWLVDLIHDSQMKNGGFTHVAPAISYDDGGGTAWQDAAPICTWVMWETYNDKRIIEQHWPQLTRYMQYLHDTSKDYLRNDKPFGDWLNLQAPTKSEVIGTAYYAHVANIMSKMAAAIGKQDDARGFAELASHIRQAFQKNFLNEDGSIKESSQTGYALAFTMGLIPDELRTKSAEKFIEEIKKKNYHLATGFIGTPRLLPALTDAGRSDIAYRLLMNDDFPSWLYQVKLGATTMWERWDGYRPDKGFQDPGMNSFNHYAFGSVGQWLYETVAGIEPLAPGYKKIRLAPIPGGPLTHAKGTYKSINGEITSAWKKTDAGIEYEFIVPPNTSAEVVLVAKDAAKITESNKPAAESPQVKLLRQENGTVTFSIPSGHYRFVVPG